MRSAFYVAVAMAIVGCGFSVSDGDIGGENGVAAPDRNTRDRSGNTPTNETTTNSDASTLSTPLPNDAGGTTTDASDAAPVTTGPLKAFVSSAIVTGGSLGGVVGADKLCNDLAKAQGLPGTFAAWISTKQVNAIDRITADGPWQRVDGQIVAQNKAQLATGALTNPLRRDEKNQEPSLAEDRTWTATTKDGKYDGFPDCNGWTSLSGTGGVGEAEHGDSRWTALLVDEACTEVNRVYCFQNQ